MRIRVAVMTCVVCSLVWSSSAVAQERHVADPAVLHQAVADRAATDQQNRDVVRALLARSEARDVASRLGLSLTRAESAVSALDSAELAYMADSARAVDTPLAGGGTATVTLSLTTLLVIIIVVLLIAR